MRASYGYLQNGPERHIPITGEVPPHAQLEGDIRTLVLKSSRRRKARKRAGGREKEGGRDQRL